MTVARTRRQIVIRAYRDADAAGLRQCVVALQEAERLIDPTLRPPEEMAGRYCEHLFLRCREAQGQIFVAADGDAIAGFVGVLAAEPFAEPDDPPGTFALVTDLVVLDGYRRAGIGRRLMEAAERFAWASGAREVRVQVLAQNTGARRLYTSAGYAPHLETLVKHKTA